MKNKATFKIKAAVIVGKILTLSEAICFKEFLDSYGLSSFGSANRAIGGLPEYKARKAKDPDYTVMDFRVEQYKKFL